MIYAISKATSKRGEREVLLEFRNWAEYADYIDNGGNAYVITEEWARQWVLDGKEHETGLPGIDDAMPAGSYEPYFPYVHAAEQPAPVSPTSAEVFWKERFQAESMARIALQNKLANAPDLLEALKAITEAYTDAVRSNAASRRDPERDIEVIDARAAIAKATA